MHCFGFDPWGDLGAEFQEVFGTQVHVKCVFGVVEFVQKNLIRLLVQDTHVKLAATWLVGKRCFRVVNDSLQKSGRMLWLQREQNSHDIHGYPQETIKRGSHDVRLGT